MSGPALIVPRMETDRIRHLEETRFETVLAADQLRSAILHLPDPDNPLHHAAADAIDGAITVIHAQLRKIEESAFHLILPGTACDLARELNVAQRELVSYVADEGCLPRAAARDLSWEPLAIETVAHELAAMGLTVADDAGALALTDFGTAVVKALGDAPYPSF